MEDAPGCFYCLFVFVSFRLHCVSSNDDVCNICGRKKKENDDGDYGEHYSDFIDGDDSGRCGVDTNDGVCDG